MDKTDLVIIQGLFDKGYSAGEIVLRMGMSLKDVELALKEPKMVRKEPVK